MFDSALHRRVALAALVALAGVAGAAAGAPAAAADGSQRDADDVRQQSAGATAAQLDAANESENVTASFVHDGDRLVLHQREDETLRLRTNAEAGARLTVEVLVDGSLAMELVAEASENGIATGPIDVEALDVASGSAVTLVAHYDEREVAETTAVVEEVSTAFVSEGDRLVLRNTENETLRIRTNAEPGREFTVRIESDSFVRTFPATVSEDGVATATLDLSGVESGTEVTVREMLGDATTEGVVLNESAALTAETTTETTSGESLDTTTTGPGSDSGVPGFGVPVALLALVAGVALGRRA